MVATYAGKNVSKTTKKTLRRSGNTATVVITISTTAATITQKVRHPCYTAVVAVAVNTSSAVNIN